MAQSNATGSSSSLNDASSSLPYVKPAGTSKSRDSVQIYRHTLEYEISALYWRLKACAQNKEICRSRWMRVSTNPPIMWQFQVFKEDNLYTNNFTASLIYSSSQTVTCAGKFELIDKTEKRLTHVEFSGVFNYQICIACINQSEASLLASIGQDKINNDVFILRCELEVLQAGSSILGKTANYKREKELCPFDWGELWKTIEIDDVVTLKLDECEYRAHKSVLSKSSPVFAAMFKTDTEEKHTNQVVIEDLDEATLKILLKYMYSNQISKADLKEETAVAVLGAAEKYMLPGLKEECEDFLIEKLSWETCLEYLKLSDVFSCPRLQSEVLLFSSSTFLKEITAPEQWKKLLESNLVSWLADVVSELTAFKKET